MNAEKRPVKEGGQGRCWADCPVSGAVAELVLLLLLLLHITNEKKRPNKVEVGGGQRR